jgi:hypothetical protein
MPRTARQFQQLLTREFSRIFSEYVEPKPSKDFLGRILGWLPEMTRKHVTDSTERKILARRILHAFNDDSGRNLWLQLWISVEKGLRLHSNSCTKFFWAVEMHGFYYRQ